MQHESPVRLLRRAMVIAVPCVLAFGVGALAATLAGRPVDQQVDIRYPPTCREPGQIASHRVVERFELCEDARAVHRLLSGVGAEGADVRVRRVENDSLEGPSQSKEVVARVRISDGHADRLADGDVATLIARTIGTSTDRIELMDESANPLFHGGAVSRQGAAATTREG